jgi:glucose-1-phosphate thymidylyltransferase
VAFADTLFVADFNLDTSKDSIIWVKQVEDPSAFGVVKLNEEGLITEFVEKPKEFISDLAIIGIYYFKDGRNLRAELQYLIDNNVIRGTEYQLTDALENMKKKGKNFYTGQVNEWLDCGNKNATVLTNQRLLATYGNDVSENITLENSKIIEPCCIADGVKITNSVVGPYVSVGKD